MKSNRSKYIANLAIGLAVVMVSYTAFPGHCWDASTHYHCRDAVYPPTNLQIGEVECSLDQNPYNDEDVVLQTDWQSGTGFCKGDNTGCYVAYDCPDEYNMVMSYFLFSDLVTWQTLSHTTLCTSCPD